MKQTFILQVFENKELEIKPAIYSDSCQLPVLKIDESSLPEPAPRPLDLMQASPSIGWSLELEDHVKSVTMTFPLHVCPTVAAQLVRADGSNLART